MCFGNRRPRPTASLFCLRLTSSTTIRSPFVLLPNTCCCSLTASFWRMTFIADSKVRSASVWSHSDKCRSLIPTTSLSHIISCLKVLYIQDSASMYKDEMYSLADSLGSWFLRLNLARSKMTFCCILKNVSNFSHTVPYFFWSSSVTPVELPRHWVPGSREAHTPVSVLLLLTVQMLSDIGRIASSRHSSYPVV